MRLQGFVRRVAAAQRAYIAAQAVVIPLLLLNWALVARHTPPLASLLRPLALAAPQLAELAIVVAVPSCTLGICIVLLAGHRLEAWQTFGAGGARLGENVLVGAPPRAPASNAMHAAVAR